VLPLEFVVDVFISPLKGFIAHELAERGYSQSRIGQLLGISQPAVSAYLKTPKAHYEEKLLKVLERRELEGLRRSILALVDSVAVDEVIRYINNYAVALLSSLRLCPLHRAAYPALQVCEICRDLVVYTETARKVEVGFEILKRCQNCHRLIPKVLMNIVELGPEGGVGFPGRVYVEGDQIVARGRPRPGGSRFLATLVGEVNKLHPEIKAVANIAYVAKECVKRKMTVAEVGPSNSEEEIVHNITAAFKSGVFDVVYDSGGRGVEPNAYVFGTDAVDVATKIVEVAKCLE
jgi:predicted fused transcriptional regulator/phosphomethylpyrimidine kinase/predicted transcriptional regulator